jgi:hypothetical protein
MEVGEDGIRGASCSSNWLIVDTFFCMIVQNFNVMQ